MGDNAAVVAASPADLERAIRMLPPLRSRGLGVRLSWAELCTDVRRRLFPAAPPLGTDAAIAAALVAVLRPRLEPLVAIDASSAIKAYGVYTYAFKRKSS
jgi:hypothetical protein